MRIAFDHQAFCRQIAGGISRYYCRLAEELSLLGQQVGTFAPVYRNVYLKELPSHLVHGYHVKNYPPKTANVCVAANALVAKTMIKRWKPDILHETYFRKRSVSSGQFPSVITVFDMISELYGQEHSSKHVDFKNTEKYKAISRAEHVICISESTRQDLVQLFDVPLNKLSVIYLGCDIPTSQLAQELSEKTVNIKPKRPFLLYVGLREGYKNFEGMLKAICASPHLLRTFDVVAFGGGKWTPSELQTIASSGFAEQQIRQISGSDQDLNLLYRQAAAFIYPSKYEGFGLPPLEAMAQQCPVVSSNTSAMPEVIGDAAEYFDPNDIDSIKSAIERVVFSEVRTIELIELGNKRISQFGWSVCAQKTLDVYKTLTKNS